MKTAQSILLVFASICLGANLQSIEAKYRAILATQQDDELPRNEEISRELNGLEDMTPEEVRTVLLSARQCWRSPRAGVRNAGLAVLLPLTLRPDSAQLLEPYISELSAFLSVPEEGARIAVVYALGAALPVPPPRAIDYLLLHLAFRSLTAEELRMTAAAILGATVASGDTASEPPNTRNVHLVLNAIDQHPQFRLKGALIEMLGTYRISNEEADRYIRGGLVDGNSSIRRTAVDAIGRMPSERRATFVTDLQRIADDPKEDSEVRSRAAAVLKAK